MKSKRVRVQTISVVI